MQHSSRAAPMPHTFAVRGVIRSIVVAVVIGAVSASCAPSRPAAWQAAVEQAVRAAPESRIIVLDIATGRLLASHHLAEARRTLAAPGSTLKPLVLYSLVAGGRWNPDRRVACDRKLMVAGHQSRLHASARAALRRPRGADMVVQQLLRRRWRARLQPGELGRLLRPTGLLDVTGLVDERGIAGSSGRVSRAHECRCNAARACWASKASA